MPRLRPDNQWLDGPQRATLRDCLLDAFDLPGFTQMLFDRLSKRLDLLVATNGLTFEQIVDGAIQKADEQSWSAELLAAAQAARPDDSCLEALIALLAASSPDIPVGIAALNASETRTHVQSAVRTWVLVTGSGDPKRYTPDLKELADYLGSQLGIAGHGMVTGGWPGVDETAARAFVAELEQLHVPVEERLIQVIDENWQPAFAGGQLIFVKQNHDFLESVRQADAVVLLGGLGGARKNGEIALKMRKPVLPIADSGGDAKVLYLEIMKKWPEFVWMRIDRVKYQWLARPGKRGVDAALNLLSEITSNTLRLSPQK